MLRFLSSLMCWERSKRLAFHQLNLMYLFTTSALTFHLHRYDLNLNVILVSKPELMWMMSGICFLLYPCTDWLLLGTLMISWHRLTFAFCLQNFPWNWTQLIFRLMSKSNIFNPVPYGEILNLFLFHFFCGCRGVDAGERRCYIHHWHNSNLPHLILRCKKQAHIAKLYLKPSI